MVAEKFGTGDVTAPSKKIERSVTERALTAVPRDPPGVLGEGAIAFGAGAVLAGGNRKLLEESDAQQFVTAA